MRIALSCGDDDASTAAGRTSDVRCRDGARRCTGCSTGHSTGCMHGLQHGLHAPAPRELGGVGASAPRCGQATVMVTPAAELEPRRGGVRPSGRRTDPRRPRRPPRRPAESTPGRSSGLDRPPRPRGNRTGRSSQAHRGRVGRSRFRSRANPRREAGPPLTRRARGRRNGRLNLNRRRSNSDGRRTAAQCGPHPDSHPGPHPHWARQQLRCKPSRRARARASDSARAAHADRRSHTRAGQRGR